MTLGITRKKGQRVVPKLGSQSSASLPAASSDAQWKDEATAATRVRQVGHTGCLSRCWPPDAPV